MNVVNIKWVSNIIFLRKSGIVEVNLFEIFGLIFEVNVFVVHDRVRHFVDDLQKVSDFGIGFVETTV